MLPYLALMLPLCDTTGISFPKPASLYVPFTPERRCFTVFKKDFTLCDADIPKKIHDTLEQIERLLLSLAYLPPIDATVQLSSTQPWIIDYRGRKHVFVWLPTTQTVSIEDLGSGTMQAGVWTNLGMPEGVRMFATGTATTIPMMVRWTNEVIP